MKITIELEQDDLNAMHDVILEALDFSPTDEQIKECWEMLPENIKGTSIKWGCNDTVFRDNMYEYLLKHKL